MSILDKYNGLSDSVASRGQSPSFERALPDRSPAEVAVENIICTPEQFFEKYKDSQSPTMDRLRYDLHSVMNDILWAKECGHTDSAFMIDFCDALNTLSTSI